MLSAPAPPLMTLSPSLPLMMLLNSLPVRLMAVVLLWSSTLNCSISEPAVRAYGLHPVWTTRA